MLPSVQEIVKSPGLVFLEVGVFVSVSRVEGHVHQYSSFEWFQLHFAFASCMLVVCWDRTSDLSMKIEPAQWTTTRRVEIH